MPTHAEKRRLPWSPDQLCAMVADVERYPEFLPWCMAARIKRRDGDTFYADLVIGFKLLRERFTSKVTVTAPDRVDVSYSDGPFRYLNNHWIFIPQPDGSTLVDFFVDFEFRSKLLQTLMQPLFGEAVMLMVGAFEKRAKALYGPGV